MFGCVPRRGELRAVQAGNVFLVDGNAHFNRPGPRLLEGLGGCLDECSACQVCFLNFICTGKPFQTKIVDGW